MATKSIGPVIVAALAADAAVTALVADRVCKDSAVLEDEALPYVTYSVDSNLPNRDLEAIDDYTADVSLTVTSADYDECDALARAVADALTDLAGTFAGVVVTDSTDPEVDDTPNGPIDSDDGEVFQSGITVSLTYK
jgi:NAD(P)-dependent dehydrogenase (short-subunit alcohol dehydrogenase family)